MATIDWASRIRAYIDPEAKAASAGPTLAAIGAAVQAAIEAHICRSFSAVTYEAETYDGHGKAVLYLRHTPVITLTSVTVAGSSVAATLTAGNEAIRHPAGAWPCDTGNVVVTYTAGLELADTGLPPEDLIFAGVIWAAMIYKDAGHIGLTSSNRGAAGSTSYTREIPPFVKLGLERWRRVTQWN